jgi:hypothetical protein
MKNIKIGSFRLIYSPCPPLRLRRRAGGPSSGPALALGFREPSEHHRRPIHDARMERGERNRGFGR